MKTRFINEGINDLLRPKSMDDILALYRKLDFIGKFETIMYIINRGFPVTIPFEEWPLILQIKHRFIKEFKQYRTTSITEMEIVDQNETRMHERRRKYLRFKIFLRTGFTNPFVTNVDQHEEGSVSLIYRMNFPIKPDDILNADATVSSYKDFVKVFKRISHAHINESIVSMLKGKSKDEIIRGLEPDEIWELFTDNATDREWLATVAIERGYKVTEADIEDAFENDYPDYIKRMMLMNYEGNLPVGGELIRIKKQGDKWKIETQEWSDFTFLFIDNRDFISDVLSGDSYEYFYISQNEVYTPSWFGNDFMEDYSYLKDFMLNELMENKEMDLVDELRHLRSFRELYQFATMNKTQLSMTWRALRRAISEAQALADEYEAYTTISNELYRFLGIENTPEQEKYTPEGTIRILVDHNTVFEILEAIYKGNGVIDPRIPYHGWNGDIKEDCFYDTLVDSITL